MPGPQEVSSAIPAMSKSATSAFSIHSWLAARSNKSQLQQKTNIIVQKELAITAVMEARGHLKSKINGRGPKQSIATLELSTVNWGDTRLNYGNKKIIGL